MVEPSATQGGALRGILRVIREAYSSVIFALGLGGFGDWANKLGESAVACGAGIESNVWPGQDKTAD